MLLSGCDAGLSRGCGLSGLWTRQQKWWKWAVGVVITAIVLHQLFAPMPENKVLSPALPADSGLAKHVARLLGVRNAEHDV